MNTHTMDSLTKTLRALTVLFVSLSALFIAAMSSFILGVHTIPGVHVGRMVLSGNIRFALLCVLIGAVLFVCYRFSRRESHNWLRTALLWTAATVAGVYAATIIFSLLRGLISGSVA